MTWGSRKLAVVVNACCVVAVWAAVARADDTWPEVSPEWDLPGAGGGLAILPLVCWWAWIAAWAATSDWIFRDSTRFKIRPRIVGGVHGLSVRGVQPRRLVDSLVGRGAGSDGAGLAPAALSL